MYLLGSLFSRYHLCSLSLPPLLHAIGQSGLGKSTLINSLFLTDLYEDSTYNPSPGRMPKTTEVRLPLICEVAIRAPLSASIQ